MIDSVEDAIGEACDWALPPHYLKQAARAAILAIADALEDRAMSCEFQQDRDAIFRAVEELDEAFSEAINQRGAA